MDGQVFVVGGFGAKGQSLATAQELDNTSATWTVLPAMPTSRWGLGAAWASGLYAIGGYNDTVGYTPVVEEYDPVSNTWSTKSPMPLPRALLSVVTGPDGRIYALGGEMPNGHYTGRVDIYDPTSDTWTCMTPMLTPRAMFAAGNTNGAIYVAGGLNASGPLSAAETYDGITPTDAAPPTFTTPPTQGFTVGDQLGKTNIPVTIRYLASDAITDIRRYDLTVSVNGGAPQPVTLPWDVFNNGFVTLPPGATTYQYAATATDCAGNTTATDSGTLFHVRAAQETGGVKYSTGWSTGTSSTYYGGHDKYTTKKGAKATHKFTGSSIAWIATKSSGRGAADVYLDGHLAAKMNLHSTTTIPRDIVFQHSWPTVGTHTITIINLASRGHPRIDIDAFTTIN
jgi:hypothetical protein